MKTLSGIFYKRIHDYISVIKFYEDNHVIGVSSSAPISKTPLFRGPGWHGSSGQYKIDDSGIIEFSLESPAGIVEYIGEILNEKTIQLKSKSYINGYQSVNIYDLYSPVINLENSQPMNKEGLAIKKIRKRFKHRPTTFTDLFKSYGFEYDSRIHKLINKDLQLSIHTNDYNGYTLEHINKGISLEEIRKNIIIRSREPEIIIENINRFLNNTL